MLNKILDRLLPFARLVRVGLYVLILASLALWFRDISTSREHARISAGRALEIWLMAPSKTIPDGIGAITTRAANGQIIKVGNGRGDGIVTRQRNGFDAAARYSTKGYGLVFFVGVMMLVFVVAIELSLLQPKKVTVTADIKHETKASNTSPAHLSGHRLTQEALDGTLDEETINRWAEDILGQKVI